MLIAARVGNAILGMGDDYTLETVASIVVGGTLISGGKANVPGTLAGCLFLGLIVTAMQIMGFSVGAQNIAKRADYRGASAGSRQQRNRRQVMIIDVHGHLGEDVVFDEQQTEEQLLDAYKKNGVDGAIIQHIC